MARTTQTVVTLTDDIDGSAKSIETISFAIDGTTDAIDLGPKNAKALRSDFEKWSERARKAKRATATTRARMSTAAKAPSEAAAIRAWATENGIAVPARGRVPASVAEQYANA